MATQAPDPRTFNSWEDAFQYPIPVVQKLEQQLRGHANENREKLRSLVGASYRDLLSTAETIIQMESSMQTVESNLSHISHNTNSRTIDRIARTTARTHKQTRARDEERYTFASQMAVLRACPAVMGRLMRTQDNYLLIAKVLVLGRLLHKALEKRSAGEGGGVKHPLTDSIRDKLASSRRKLLRRVDKRLATGDGETESLVQTMCAYALATSSSPSDVLRHFHHVRMERILGCLRKETIPGGVGLKDHGVEALKLCLKTTQDTQAIFPRRLADALVRLKSHPLTQDADVRACYELNLDVHERWIGDEARNYTPQPRHDELQRGEAERLLGVWGKQAIQAFMRDIKEVLRDTRDLKEVAELRQEVVETWIVQGSRMAGVKSRDVLHDLRGVLNEQLGEIVRERAAELGAVVEVIKGTLERWEAKGEQELSLWNSTAAAADLSDGAKAFKERIINMHQGRDEAVIRVVEKYDEWMAQVLEVKSIVKHMKETRWDDPFSDDIDLDDSDDETESSSKQTLLSKDDPNLLEEVTQKALADALTSLGKSFGEISAELIETEEDKERVSKAIFLLRVIRELNDRIPNLTIQDHHRASPPASPFTKEISQPLHLVLANNIIHPVLETYRQSLHTSSQHRSNSHILWEGHPPLPAQPSPSAFRFLRDLVKSMAQHGSDLWVAEGVSVLKGLTKEEITKIWLEHTEAIKDSEEVVHTPPPSDSDGSEPADPSSPVKKRASSENGNGSDTETPGTDDAPQVTASDPKKSETLKQLAFDILYIRNFVSPHAVAGAGDGGQDNEAWDAVSENAGLDEGMSGRLEKSVGDYGRKTYLLFGILA